MGRTCSVITCKNSYKNKNITFHQIPDYAILKRKWIEVLEGNVKRTVKTIFICSDHFNNESLDKSGPNVQVKLGCVPTKIQFTSKKNKF
nr:THAP domain-containing protein 6-like [Onthophagus taurus]